ncbi:MAG TPA: hypothetical protein PLJ76_04530 [Treponemataceae bacterium]|nr:hypothetical protein [Treponemataceae bacterium]
MSTNSMRHTILEKKLMQVAALLLFAVFLPVSALALDFSAGGGLSLNTLFVFAEYSGMSENKSATGFGIHAFADATYAELSGGIVAYEDTTYMRASLLVKYPFEIAGTRVFPLAGAEYRWNLDYDDASTLVLKGGAGADVVLTDRLFLRPEVLLGYAFLTKLEEDRIDAWEIFGGGSISKMTLDISASAGYRF